MKRAPTTVTVRFSWDRPTGNFWVDTGLVVLLRHFGEGEHPVKDVLSWLQGQLLQPSGNRGQYYDRASGRIREYDKVNWVYPTNLFELISKLRCPVGVYPVSRRPAWAGRADGVSGADR
jgi:hypothetical protein